MLKPVLVATAIAGTLDLIAAFVFAGAAGMAPAAVLRFVASGPFGDAALTGSGGWMAVGLAVHYAIMAAMAATFIAAARRMPVLVARPLVAGVAYGLLLWFIMYWIVRPLRWPAIGILTDPQAIAGQWLCHLILVGVPIALVAACALRSGRA